MFLTAFMNAVLYNYSLAPGLLEDSENDCSFPGLCENCMYQQDSFWLCFFSSDFIPVEMGNGPSAEDVTNKT